MLSPDSQQNLLKVSEDPVVAFVRWVLHHWTDGPNIKIPRNSCTAAEPATFLVIFDSLMLLACIVPGGLPPPSSPPLGNLDEAIGALLTMLNLEGQ